VDDETSMRALHAAIDGGVNFIDTADVYGDGRSERLIARLRRERPGETIHVATKAGRRLPAQTVEGYTRANLIAWVDRSLANLEADALDLLQLHCPPTDVYYRPEVFGALEASADQLKALIKQNDWNQVHLIARGNTFAQMINGHMMAMLIDEDATKFKPKGVIGLQCAGSGTVKISFRNLWLRRY